MLLALLCGPLARLEAAPPKPAEPVEVLPTVKVKGEVQCSFGFGVSLLRQPETRKISRLFITRVSPKSSAAKLGLGPGDEILAINGEKIRGMDGEAKQGAKLFSLLCDRAAGETIEIEVLSQERVQHLTLQAGK